MLCTRRTLTYFPALLRADCRSRQYLHGMNRPRNRQARPPRNDDRLSNRSQRGVGYVDRTMANVPTVQQVVPGASVSIVLKQDQATGHEVKGTVQDLLTRGNHPRGIKVRLVDGRVGRVQRMTSNNDSPADQSHSTSVSAAGPNRVSLQHQDHVSTEPHNGGPASSLGDFIVHSTKHRHRPFADSARVAAPEPVVKCPICGLFEGDEAAVSHHVESHLDQERGDPD